LTSVSSSIYHVTNRMKHIPFIIFLFISIGFTACKDNPAEKYGDTVIEKYKDTQEFGDRVSLQRLQQAVQTFRITNGRLPESLEELENFTGEKLDKNRYDYDPDTGTLALKE